MNGADKQKKIIDGTGKKVMVAMSGGVDSSAVGLLLRAAGYEVTGVTGRMFDGEELGVVGDSRCCSLADIEDARLAARKIGAPHYTYNMTDDFRKTVIEPFVEEYWAGTTPNPCINCNRYVKFPVLLKRALLLGFDYLATGHYAQVEFDQVSGRWLLKRAADKSKDQTYMLYALSQDELSHVLFPLGCLDKSEVRARAAAAGLVNAAKPDSQDLCFVPDGDYAGFIERLSAKKMPEGNFVLTDGTVVGKHHGLLHYTIGQRKGLGIAWAYPLYVVRKDAARNEVVLGREEELYRQECLVRACNFISVPELRGPLAVTCKTRYRMEDQPAVLEPAGEFVKVTFKEPQRAITPGQAAVFYDGELVVGGGTIV